MAKPQQVPVQVVLWHNSPEEAVDTAVLAAGGYEKIAALLWPALKAQTAYTRLKHCLDPEKEQKFALGELFMIWTLAAQAGDHSITRYAGGKVGFEFKALTDEEAQRRRRKEKIQYHLNEASRLSQEEA